MSVQNTLSANSASNLLQILANIKTQDLSYKIKPTYPFLARKLYSLQPKQTVSGAPASKEAIWDLNKAWLNNGLRIQTTITKTGSTSFSAPTDKYYGLTMYESITLRTNNVTLATLSDSYIRSRVDHLPDGPKQHCLRYSLALVPTTEIPVTDADATTFVTYTPIFSSFFEHVTANLNLNFLEQFQVVARFNTTVNSGINEAYLSASPVLQVFNWTPDATYMAGLKALNNPVGSVMTMLTYNSSKESFNLDSDTGVAARLRCNYPVFNMYFAVVSKAAVADLGIATSLSPINTVDFTIGGDSMMGSAVPISTLDYINEMGGAVSSNVLTTISAVSRSVQTVGTGTYCGWRRIPFCLDPDNRTYCSGAMAFSGINNPILTLAFPDVGTGSNFELQVCYEAWQLISISSSGVCQIAEMF